MESVGGRVAVDAEINPGGLETNYELRLVCETCAPIGYSPSVGKLPAVEEARTVILDLPGIPWGTYEFEVIATNAAGEAFQRSDLEVPRMPGIPENKPTPYESKVESIAGAEEQTSRELTAKAEAEREALRAREQAEREAEEAPLRLVVEREEREAAEVMAAESKQAVAECVVPSLVGRSRGAAQRALAEAHCTLGKVTKLRGGHGVLVVVGQSAKHGRKLPGGARVAIELGSPSAARSQRT
jgi:hypothetical protein